MKFLVGLCCLVGASMLVYIGVDAYQSSSPQYALEQKYRKLFVGGAYKTVRKIGLQKARLVKSTENEETFDQDGCISTFKTKDGVITDFHISGTCVAN